jgi:hypothetical protein
MRNSTSRAFATGVATIAVLTSCGGGQSAPASTSLSSVHLSANGANYLGAQSRVLTGFAVGVGKGKIVAGSRVSLSSSDNGVNASDQVWYGKSLQTAKGFSLDYASTYASQPTAKHVRGIGHLYVASTGSVPVLTAARTTADTAVLLSAREQPAAVFDAQTTGGTTFNVGSDTGGQLGFNGSQMTYTDAQGKVLGQHTFDAGDDLEKSVQNVLDAVVPPPSASLVKATCQPGVSSVANTQVFSLSVDEATTKSQTIISVLVTKNVQTDCKTNQVAVTTMVDVSGDIDGNSFLAVSDSPPVPDTATPDSSPAPPQPQLVIFTPDPADATLISLPVKSDGQLPTLAGAYSGTYTGTQSTTGGSSHPFSGPMALSVAGKTVTITSPGSGAGTVDEGGGASFSFTISKAQAQGGTGGTCKFVGFLVNTSGAKSAHGSMSCTGPGDSASASWTAAAS